MDLEHPKRQGRRNGFFRKAIKLNKETKSANLTMSCDNGFEAFVNGKKVLVGSDWGNAQKTDVKKHLKPGMNLIAVKAWNDGGVAGLVGKLEVVSITDRHKAYTTDSTWRSSSSGAKGWEKLGFDANGWKTSTETGKLGDNPWGNVFVLAQQGGTDVKKSNPADLKLAKGFKSERLHRAEGSARIVGCRLCGRQGPHHRQRPGRQGAVPDRPAR